jgi:signal transduction histidine kinase
VDTGFEKEKPERIKEGWDGLKTIISRIRKLVHNILFFAKERELKWDRVDVLNFVDDVAATVELKIKAKGIEFVCNFDTALGAFEIDAGVVRLALINILENALKMRWMPVSKMKPRNPIESFSMPIRKKSRLFLQ